MFSNEYDNLNKLLRSCIGIELEISSKLGKDKRTRWQVLEALKMSILNHNALLDAIARDLKLRLYMQKAINSHEVLVPYMTKYPQSWRVLKPKIDAIDKLALEYLSSPKCK